MPDVAASERNGARGRIVRVFISSTFQDMQAERDELSFRVFPELRARCAERGIALIDVDLRWGITEEQEIRGEVLPLCLRQIDESRPFFIGLLGERYGSVLPHIDESLLASYPWLRYHGARSLTEIEFLHGALLNVASAHHAFFYFRSAKFPLGLPAGDRTRYLESDPARAQQLRDLKQRVRESGFPVVDDYADPQSVGDRVLDDLWRAICTLPQPPESRETREARPVFDFLDFRVDRPETERLDDLVRKEGGGIALSGPAGSGKSALLADWVQRFRTGSPATRVFEHYLSGATDDPDAGELLMRLADWLGVERPPGAQRRHLRELLVPLLPAALERAASEAPLLLVIDGLDRLRAGRRAADLSFLPAALPQGVSVVCSTRAGPMLDAAQQRGWRVVALAPLSQGQRDALIVRYFERWGKQLDRERRLRLAGHPLAGNPLFLRTMLEQLRVASRHDQLDQHIGELLGAQSPPALYALIVRQLEARLTETETSTLARAMRLLWASRRGLAESELLDLVAGEDASGQRRAWSRLFLALQESLEIRSGRITLGQDYMREAVCARYFDSPGDETLTRDRLIAYFATLDDARRRLEELPWQLREVGRTEELRDLLALPSNFACMWEGEMQLDLFDYWSTLANTTRIAEVMLASFDRLARDELQPSAQADYAMAVGRFLKEQKEHEAAARLFERARACFADAYGWDDPRVADCYLLLGFVRYEQGDQGGAAAAMRRALALRQKRHGPLHAGVAEGLMGLAMALAKLGDPAAKQLFERALELMTKVRGRDHPQTAIVLDNMAGALPTEEAATQWHREALGIAERSLGPDHPSTAKCLDNLAQALLARGSYDEAEALARRALDIWSALRGADHPDTLVSLGILEQSSGMRGDYLGASRAYRRRLRALSLESDEEDRHALEKALLLCTALVNSGHAGEAVSLLEDYCLLAQSAHGAIDAEALCQLAGTMYDLGALQGAERAFTRALDSSRSALRSKERNRAWALMGLSKVNRDRGDLASASELLAEAGELCRTAPDSQPTDELECLNLMTVVALEKGELEQAESASTAALGKAEAAAAPRAWIGGLYDLRSRVFAARGDLAGAELAGRKALEMLSAELPVDSPPRVSATHNLGVVRFAQNEFDEAETLLRSAAEARARVLGDAHPSTVNSRTHLAQVLLAKGAHAESLEAIGGPAQAGEARSLRSDATHVQQLLLKARNLQALGKFEEAEASYRRALQVYEAQAAPTWPLLLEALAGLGHCLEKQKKLDDAERVLRRALALAEGAAPPEQFETLIHLARVVAAKEEVEEAEALLRRALSIERAQPQRGREAALWGEIAASMMVRGEYRQAATLFERSVSALAGELGTDSEVTQRYRQMLEKCRRGVEAGAAAQASALLDLAEKGLMRRDFDAGQRRLQQALEIAEGNPPQPPLLMGRALSMLGAVHEWRGQLGEAEAVLRRGLVLIAGDTPEARENTIVGYGNLAHVLAKQGKHEEAARLFALVLHSRGADAGLIDPGVLGIVVALATSLVALDRDEEAAGWVVRAIDANAMLFRDAKSEAVAIYFTLASVFNTRFSQKVAAALVDRVLELVSRESAIWPLLGAHASFFAAAICARAGRAEEAQRHFEAVLQVLDVFLDPKVLDTKRDIPENVLSWASQAAAYLAEHRDRATGQWDKALANYRLAAKLQRRMSREVEALCTEFEIHAMRRDAGRPVDTDRVRELVQAIAVATTAGKPSASNAAELNNTATLVRRLGLLDEAERLSRTALQIDEQVRDPHDLKIAHRLNNLSVILLLQDKLEEARRCNARAWQIASPKADVVAGRTLIVRVMLALLAEDDIGPWLGQLKTLMGSAGDLPAETSDRRWNATDVFERLKSRLPAESVRLCSALVEALNDREALGGLDKFESWRGQTLVPLQAAWPPH